MMKVGFNPSINFKASDSQFSTEPMAATISGAETKNKFMMSTQYKIQKKKKVLKKVLQVFGNFLQ